MFLLFDYESSDPRSSSIAWSVRRSNNGSYPSIFIPLMGVDKTLSICTEIPSKQNAVPQFYAPRGEINQFFGLRMIFILNTYTKSIESLRCTDIDNFMELDFAMLIFNQIIPMQ